MSNTLSASSSMSMEAVPNDLTAYDQVILIQSSRVNSPFGGSSARLWDGHSFMQIALADTIIGIKNGNVDIIKGAAA